MKTALSLFGTGLAMMLAFPMTAHADDLVDHSPASASEILLASNTRPAFRQQQRFRYRYAMRSHRRYRQHRYRRYRC